jgi:hypothetical protein
MLLFITCIVKGQGGNRIVYDLGLPLHIQPMVDVGIQVKHYWVFDTTVSNNGPGAAIEVNFGTNNSGFTFGPKVFYQVDVFLGDISEKKKTGLYIIGRASFIRYSSTEGVDYRAAPEVGISILELVSLTYGYNFPLPFGPQNRISGVFNSRLTLALTLHGKERGIKSE